MVYCWLAERGSDKPMSNCFQTPLIGNEKSSDFENVYEPSEDSFLLLDVLEKEHSFLQNLNPLICLEVGCGSGICITFLSQILQKPSIFLCTDINSKAANMARLTGEKNKQSINPVVCDLTNALEDRIKGSVDILLFNPPYVVTPSEEVSSNGISAAWAGGVRGREVIDRFLPKVNLLLSPSGVFYMVVVKENDPADIEQAMLQFGFVTQCVGTRRAGPEHLSILKFTRLKSLGHYCDSSKQLSKDLEKL
ncbi:methyltransferase N6AMT1-like isoform X2 [Physella acuta]|uniref:methyltransferase N6AMT1-like isoform X2 n=1 Tax=Physella acuta TaxID=109671 RepID=UPI0027DDDB62|nr:methyltransferase N6AMT1-like isoform X2 [Physella acuta]